MIEELEYRRDLEARVTQQTHVDEDGTDVSAVSFRESAFTDVVLETLLDLGQVPDIETCYFRRTIGRYAVKVNGWACDKDSGEVDLVTTLYAGAGGPESFPPSEVRSAITRAARVVAESHRGVHREMEPASPAWDMMQSLHEAASDVTKVRVVVASDLALKDIGKLEHDFPFEIQADVWDLTRLHRAEASGLPYEPVAIDLVARLGRGLPCIPAPDISEEYDAYLALIPG
ncbi:MAG: hypothetical protein RLN75_08465, partial [Longimicrobiales bacterium]